MQRCEIQRSRTFVFRIEAKLRWHDAGLLACPPRRQAMRRRQISMNRRGAGRVNLLLCIMVRGALDAREGDGQSW